MNEEKREIVMNVLVSLISDMKIVQSEAGRSDLGRYVSVAVTDLEKVAAYWNTYVK